MLKVYTQIGAVAYAVILGAKRAIELRGFAKGQAGFVTGTMLQLVAGASLLRFAVDQNDAHGLGDGIALLICAGIGASERPAQLLRFNSGFLAISMLRWVLMGQGRGPVKCLCMAPYLGGVPKLCP